MEIFESIKKWMDNSIVDELLLVALLIAITENFAQTTIKSSDNHNSITFFLGLSIYILIGYLLHYAYHKFPLSKLNVIWSCITIILAMVIGYIFYDEPLNKWKMLAVMFALMAIYFTYLSEE